MRAIFSLPFSPYMKQNEYEEAYLPFVQKYSEYIYDIYTTIHVEPFGSDAMGSGGLDSDTLIQKALKLQSDTQKPISATFNDTTVAPTLQNLELFIQNFTPLYEAGIHSATIPHIHWMLAQKLFEYFPNLKIKNTVLNRIDNAQSYWDSALAGYSVINLDRKLLRDHATLKEIKKAQTLFGSKFGFAPLTQLLANENCIGLCPAMGEHFLLNIKTGTYGINYTCKRWKTLDEAYGYRVANIPPFREDIDEILEYVDLLKLHGRGGTALLQESMQIVSDYAKSLEVLEFAGSLFQTQSKSTIQAYRKTIKTCKFQCWGCDVCDGMV